ncbi:MAG: UDP-glucose 4-epimerase GalE [Methanobrevibacter sp.]|jgi:UDP-glucose 4-epimerase|nr:UDP-glucose 4-epimerase GalE [Candidatus Methanovirga aequatorialis]
MILITGAAGYIGSHVNKLMHENGYQTIVLDNLHNGHEEMVKWGKFVKCDLKDVKLLSHVFEKYDIEAVIHLAALASVKESVEFPQKYYKNNFQYTKNLLNVMEKFKVGKFIFSSTASVYGEPNFVPISEEHQLKPMNPYGESKLMVENLLSEKSKNSDFNYVIFRYFNVAGADSNSEIGEIHEIETHLIPKVLDVALGKSKRIAIFGDDYPTPDGTCIRDYIHVNDVASAHLKGLNFLENDKSDVFNLGIGRGFSVKEIIKSCEEVTNCYIPTVVEERREGDPAILICDNQKAYKTLKWKAELNNVYTMIESAYNFHRKL